jgi:hypothetical protein
LRHCNAWLQPSYGIPRHARALAERNGRPPVPNTTGTSFHRINRVLSRGDIREGLLLGVGCERPPDTYKNYDKVPITFTIVDQWDCRHPGKLQMRMNRLPARSKAICKRTRAPLLSCPDIVAPRRSLIAPPEPTGESRKKDAETIRRALEEMVRVSSKREYAKVPIGAKAR